MSSKEHLLCIYLLNLSFLLSDARQVASFGEILGNVSDVSQHPCKRPCRDDEPARICRYEFVVEKFSTMSKACYDCPQNLADCYRPDCLPGDGQRKTIVVANRQLPGPTIEVCVNDRIIVEARNKMRTEVMTLHWHGVDQKGTPYMDGVHHVTQCGILPGEKFVYDFTVTESGTLFWHSHIGALRVDGLTGAMIVREGPKRDVHRKLYDVDEHIMVLMDWMKRPSGTATVKEYYEVPNVKPESFLINGLARNKPFSASPWSLGLPIYTPFSVFNIEQGKRNRFRVINAGGRPCAIEMSIDQHPLQVISLDANDIEPIEVDAITLFPGERIDFVINPDKPVNNYWIRYKGHGACAGLHQVTLLRYKGADNNTLYDPLSYKQKLDDKNIRVLNPNIRGNISISSKEVRILNLKSIKPNDITLKKKADVQLYINFDIYHLDHDDYHRKGLYGYYDVDKKYRAGSLQMNNINFMLPPFPVLSQQDMIGPKTFCNATWNLPKADCIKEQCSCTNLLRVDLNRVVELILVDEGQYEALNHAMHLHGFYFRVVAEEQLEGRVTVDRIKQLDRQGKIKRNLDRPPLKDTMKAPSNGFIIVRFFSDNPGYWFFHCHYEHHTSNGMALLFKVGEHSDFPPVPKNFPKCGWLSSSK
ncbi:hypothetical protein TKK_0005444 [Trichogramma kaykai]|uniref:Uncharacterized protein n=1 Tax=Trichogramma kaykai TaxID=54128 RepID=A0ABD2XHC6_9HYME